MTGAAFRRSYDTAPDLLTVGVEEELLLVRADGVELAPVGPELVEALLPDRRFTRELRAAQIEIVTPVCLTIADVERELASARTALALASDGLARPVAVPVSPACADPGPVTDRERYRAIVVGAPWAGRELLTCGLHVHVGVAGADRAIAVHDALRSYLPLLAAISANSPFHDGEDTRVACVRARLKQHLPRSGVPPALVTWDGYERFLRWGAAGGVVPDPTFHWYDLRLNPRYGTIEVRAFDVQTGVTHAAALAALVQALVAMLLDRHDGGRELPLHDSHLIAEALWLAARDGASGSLPDLDTGRLLPVHTHLERLLEELRPHAAHLGSITYLDHLHDLERLPGHERQRLVHEANGIAGLVDWLARETRASSRRPIVGVDEYSLLTENPAA